MKIGDGLITSLIILVILVIIITLSISRGIMYFTGHKIKSEKIIVPEKQLIIKDNKVDTLYIYKKQ